MNNNNTKRSGILYVVSTPIGNLQDITFRAIETLKTVKYIVAEDTRHSQSLLRHFAINTPSLALHEHNEREQSESLLTMLDEGESLALISDAGTPLISDPGYYFVREAKRRGLTVVPVPGACAVIAALSVAGLPTDRFLFEGFLPAKAEARKERLLALQQEPRTMVFYEAPHRILALLEAMQVVFGEERLAVVARELTKMFETVKSDTLGALVPWVRADSNQQRGEIVVIVSGAMIPAQEMAAESDRVLTVLLETVPLKQAVDLAVKLTGQRKNVLYEAALQWQKNKL